MSSQPAQSVDEIRQQLLREAGKLAAGARSIAWWRGVLLWLTVIVITLALLIAADFFLRREELGLRVLSLAALLAAAVFAARRLLVPTWRFAPSPIQLAQWIERNRPDLGGRLSTAVEIAATKPHEDRYGSQSFRNAVLRAWNAEAEKPDWRSYLDTRQVWRAAALLAITSLFFMLGVFSNPSASKLALMRLMSPWSSHAWPRRDQLQFVQLPSVVASGSELQLEVIDRNPPLPVEVEIQLRDPNGGVTTAVVPTKQVEQVAVANLPAVEKAFDVRAVGGDDQAMPWQRIEVVEPPKLVEHRFEIEPPEYTGQAAEEIVGNRIQVLADSRVRFFGQLTESVGEVSLVFTNGTQVIDEDQPDAWTVKLASDGRTLVIGGGNGTKLKQSINWRFALTTADGLRIEQPQLWSIEVVSDNPPQVSLETPAMKQIAENAALQLSGAAADDIGLVEVAAWIGIENRPDVEPQKLEVWTSDGEELRELPVKQVWEFASEFLARGEPLSQGDVLSLWLEARDGLGQVTKSQLQPMEVQPADEILDEILSRQKELSGRLRELVEAQRRNQQLADQSAARLAAAEAIARQDVDGVMGVAEMQRAIGNTLSGSRDSIAAEVRAILQQLELNKLADTPASEQVRFLADEIEAIATGSMRTAVEAVGQAKTGVQTQFNKGAPPDKETLQQLGTSTEAQGRVLEDLQGLADRVDRNGALQQIQQDFANVASEQEALRAETDALQLQSLSGIPQEELDKKQRAASGEQLGLAQRLEGLLSRSWELANSSKSENPALVEQLEEIAAALTEGEASRLMRQATDELNSSQFSAASETQKDVNDLLSKALRRLNSRATGSAATSLEGRAEDLRQAAQDLAKIASAQSQLAGQMQQAESPASASELADQQTELMQEAERQASESEAQGDLSTSNEIQDAVDEQERAAQAAEDRQMQQAGEAAANAAEKLQSAAERLENRAQELQRQAQQQQLYQLGSSLGRLVEQQTPVVQRLEMLAQTMRAGGATPSEDEYQTQSRELAAEQEAVRQTLRDVRGQAESLPTFDWALEQVETDMSRSVAAAQRYRIDPEALTAAGDALRKLELAKQSLETQSGNEPPEGEQPSQDQGQEKRSALPPVASLKLIRGLQFEINQETRALENEPEAAPRNRRLAELTQQQQFLGDQLGKLLEEIKSATQTTNETPQ